MPDREKAKKRVPAFSREERDAMKERARELKRKTSGAAAEAEVRATIAAMAKSDRVVAERVHEIVRATAPTLEPKLWYGMPAYADGGKVVCFLQAAGKFGTRYATLGFSDRAALDAGAMWPTTFAITEIDAATATQIAELVKQAIGPR